MELLMDLDLFIYLLALSQFIISRRHEQILA